MTKIIWYNELAKNNSNIEQREHAIKELSDKICTRRKEYASILEHDLANIRMDKDQILELITNIRTSYDVLNDNKREELVKKCKELEETIMNYEETSNNLCIRFRNQKIKVVAFGPKSQGKSTFTCLYTGLDESIVSVKQAGNDDKTGATSVIQHRENEELEIRVFLKSQEELLSIINSSLKALSSLKLDIPGTTAGVFKSWKDFMDIMNNHIEKGKVFKKIYSLRNTAQVKNFTSNVAVLTSIFRTENSDLGIKGASDFSEVLPESKISKEIKDKGIKISKSDLPMYNDMQHTGNQRYMTVSHIKIFTDLKRQNMFENFEICDTKGLSEDAGGSAHENLIYKQLNEADAAFSIFMLKTGDMSQHFYENLANRIHSKDDNLVKPSDFSSKHFAILNIAEDGFTGSTPKVAHDIKGNEDVANKVYIGAFKTQSYDGKMIDAKLFADSLIFDMLETVVANTKQQDDSLINDCNKLQSKVIACKNELVNVLSDIQDESEENKVEYILLEKIESFRISAMTKLEELALSHNITLTDEEVVINNTNSKVSTSKNDEYDYEYDIENSENAFLEPSTPMPKEKLSLSTTQADSKRDARIFRMITADSTLQDSDINNLLSNRRTSESVSVSDIAISYILDKKIRSMAGSNVYMGKNLKYAIKVKGSASDIGGYIDSVSDLLFKEIRDNINGKYTGSQDIISVLSLRDKLYCAIWSEFKLDKLYDKFNGKLLNNNSHNEIIKVWLDYYNKPQKDLEASAIIPEVSYNILISYFKNSDYKTASNLGVGSIIDWELLKRSICEVYKRFDFEGRALEKLTNEERLKRNIFKDMQGSLMSLSSLISGIIGMYPTDPDRLLRANIIESTEYKKISNHYKWEVLINTREQLNNKSVTSLQNII